MGRAPTSGNCHTCRQRRVKCDQARPACARCVRGNFECQGYEVVMRMQNHAVVSGAAPGSVRLGKIQAVSSFPVARGKAGQPRAAGARALQTSQGSTATLQPTSTSTSPPDAARASTPLVPQPSLVGFVDDMAVSYFYQAYGWINMHSILLQDAAMQRHAAAHNADVHRDSLRALCYGLLGRDKHIPALQDAGRRVYGRAMAQLRTAITASSKDALADLVKPIAFLGSYAVAVERDLRFTHHMGLARILEVCGPEYFQTPDRLAVFESVRMTLVSDAFVRRRVTFLAQPRWKTVPWALHPEKKSATSRLLDIFAAIPSIVEGIWGLLGDRVKWLVSGGGGGGGRDGSLDVPRIEDPSTVAQLQARVLHEIREPAAAWHRAWAASSELAPRILAWAYARGGGDDTYRPGPAFGYAGPDPFDTLVGGIDGEDLASIMDGPGVSASTLMQDAALYTTVLVLAVRLDRYLSRAAQSPTCVDFLSQPFRSTCHCRHALHCETVPPPTAAPTVERTMAWNAATCVAVGPVHFSDSGGLEKDAASQHALQSDTLLPGDIRFVAHMRILAWLSARLPATRSAMLSTLAAVGLAHCAHDVRPAEGRADIAAVAVARVMDSTGVDGAADILLKRYGPIEV